MDRLCRVYDPNEGGTGVENKTGKPLRRFFWLGVLLGVIFR